MIFPGDSRIKIASKIGYDYIRIVLENEQKVNHTYSARIPFNPDMGFRLI